ncbi:MAG: ABC transporter permease [Pseudomonadota bacterium]
MRLIFEKRPQASRSMRWLAPVIAIFLTVLCGSVLFAASGIKVSQGLYIYFIEPLVTIWSWEELIIKAAPLILIATGLVVCFRANVWNIGAEGQLVAGALAGSILPIEFAWQVWWGLPLMLITGAIGGACFAAIPAFLKNRMGVNEILTSLMLVYVAGFLLDWLVRGPWRDPHGFNFPKSIAFEGWYSLPTFGDGRLHAGTILVLLVVGLAWFVFARTRKGFEIIVFGEAPRAAAFAGFSRTRLVWMCFLVSGACSGLAGIIEVAGPVGQLQPSISPGYGFTAIIVAFLARLYPPGVLFGGLLLAISYIGGEGAQIALGLSDKIAQVFQGLLLFFLLAADFLVHYRIRLTRLRLK